MLRKVIILGTIVITIIAFRANIDVMLNNGSMWNTMLSVIVWILWAVVIAGILLRAKENKRPFLWLLAMIAVIMISNYLVFAKGIASSPFVSVLTIIAFPSALPFLGICGGLTKIGMSDLPALEIPYLLFAAEILICCYITKKKISVNIPDGGNRVSG